MKKLKNLLFKLLCHKWLIDGLIDYYNSRVIHKKRIEVREPQSFLASVSMDIDTKAYSLGDNKDDNLKMLKNIIAEKKYDMRSLLMNQIKKEGFIKENVDIKDNQINIELELKVFDYERKKGKEDRNES